ALYRLIGTDGREHESASVVRRGADDVAPIVAAEPRDAQAMVRYVEQYAYDLVGNLKAVQHRTRAGAWKRSFEYEDTSNRLLRIRNGAAATEAVEQFHYTPNGCLSATNEFKTLNWN